MSPDDASPTRFCIICWTPISACMGFCLARDVVALLNGEKLDRIRELCGLCILLFDTALLDHPMRILAEVE